MGGGLDVVHFHEIFVHCTCLYTARYAESQIVKNLPAVQEAWVPSLGWEDPLEKGKATHSSILALRILRTVWSMGLQRIGHN